MTASILTNSSAMIALQTLRDTNMSLREVNNQISTGKKISTAKDNAAIFAISTIMNSDVGGFTAVAESLSLGQSTLGVAAAAAGEVNGLLQQIRDKMVSSQNENIDRVKLQDEVISLTAQINSVIGSAQFNGLNLLDGSAATDFNITSSVNRTGAGSVTVGEITVAAADTDLSQTTAAAVLAFDGDDDDDGGSFTIGTDQDGDANVSDFVGTVADGASGDIALQDATLADQTVITIEIDGLTFSATANGANDGTAVAAVLRDQINQANIGVTAAVTEREAGTEDDDVLTLTNASGAAIVVQGSARSASTVGGLDGLANLAAQTALGASDAEIGAVDALIDNVTSVEAAIGTAQTRVESQSDFISKLIDSFKTGIGSLIDADLEAASARLQSLQVQQQLGTQALSIANQQPQNLLALFR